MKWIGIATLAMVYGPLIATAVLAWLQERREVRDGR